MESVEQEVTEETEESPIQAAKSVLVFICVHLILICG